MPFQFVDDVVARFDRDWLLGSDLGAFPRGIGREAKGRRVVVEHLSVSIEAVWRLSSDPEVRALAFKVEHGPLEGALDIANGEPAAGFVAATVKVPSRFMFDDSEVALDVASDSREQSVGGAVGDEGLLQLE